MGLARDELVTATIKAQEAGFTNVCLNCGRGFNEYCCPECFAIRCPQGHTMTADHLYRPRSTANSYTGGLEINCSPKCPWSLVADEEEEGSPVHWERDEMDPTDGLRSLERCQAGKDGECNWERCPQNRDGEPVRSGRSCPLWVHDEEE